VSNVEIILWWLLAGVAADLMLHFVITVKMRSVMEKWRADEGIADLIKPEPFANDYIETLKVCPWWARVLIYALPISILLHSDIMGD
jgi:hypothetical protein